MRRRKLCYKGWIPVSLFLHGIPSENRGGVDTLITVGTVRRVPRVDNMYDRQIAAAGQH